MTMMMTKTHKIGGPWPPFSRKVVFFFFGFFILYFFTEVRACVIYIYVKGEKIVYVESNIDCYTLYVCY